ncbi:MAG: M90 family metallopeptidase [Pseudomonadota bacterium]
MTWFFLILLAALALSGRRIWKRRRTRDALLAAPLTNHHRALVDVNVPLLTRLPGDLQPKLEGKINRFLDQVEFIGCDGLEVTEAMRLAIAAQACLLIVNVDRWYDTLRTILIYPGAFKSHQKRQDGYVVTEREEVRSGESWARGPIVLSWSHSAEGALDDRDGHNVVLHEFAHQLDQLSGHTDGAPLMNKGQSFDDWSRVFLDAFEQHEARVAKGTRTVLDAYGAKAHEEFFAVAVEVFFERPDRLKAEEPEVYDQLALLLNLDPASWTRR